MSGISTPTGRKCVLLFTNADANKVTKYCDGWKVFSLPFLSLITDLTITYITQEDGTFQYSGAGQKGDQHWFVSESGMLTKISSFLIDSLNCIISIGRRETWQ